MADSGASHSGARSICREIPDFCDKIAGADFAGKNLSQKSGAKVKLVRLTFATRRGPDSGPLRTWCRFQELRDYSLRCLSSIGGKIAGQAVQQRAPSVLAAFNAVAGWNYAHLFGVFKSRAALFIL